MLRICPASSLFVVDFLSFGVLFCGYVFFVTFVFVFRDVCVVSVVFRNS